MLAMFNEWTTYYRLLDDTSEASVTNIPSGYGHTGSPVKPYAEVCYG